MGKSSCQSGSIGSYFAWSRSVSIGIAHEGRRALDARERWTDVTRDFATGPDAMPGTGSGGNEMYTQRIIRVPAVGKIGELRTAMLERTKAASATVPHSLGEQMWAAEPAF